MFQELLIARIDAAIDAANAVAPDAASKTSRNKACLEAGLGRDYVRDIERAGQDPGVSKLKKLAKVLLVDPHWLLDAIDPDEAEIARGSKLQGLGGNESAPKRGQFINAESELALLAFWRSLDNDKRDFVLSMLRNGVLGGR